MAYGMAAMRAVAEIALRALSPVCANVEKRRRRHAERWRAAGIASSARRGRRRGRALSRGCRG